MHPTAWGQVAQCTKCLGQRVCLFRGVLCVGCGAGGWGCLLGLFIFNKKVCGHWHFSTHRNSSKHFPETSGDRGKKTKTKQRKKKIKFTVFEDFRMNDLFHRLPSFSCLLRRCSFRVSPWVLEVASRQLYTSGAQLYLPQLRKGKNRSEEPIKPINMFLPLVHCRLWRKLTFKILISSPTSLLLFFPPSKHKAQLFPHVGNKSGIFRRD